MSFYGIYGWKANWKTVTHMSKKMTIERKKIAFISCQMNTEERHMLTLALIGRRSPNYEKEGMELNRHPNRRNQIPVLFFIQRRVESHLLTNYENGPWQFAKKVLQWQASWQTKSRQEGSSTIRKQQSGLSGLEWDLPNHWKASPMMKNQTAKIKKVKSSS